MKITSLVFLIIMAIPALLLGQGESSNWYFGEGAGLRFNSDGSTTTLNDGSVFTYEGCATISDPSGNLLFYTDGRTVYDRNHNIMSNGTGLYGDPSSTQAALIVPKPEDPNLYYIFTVDTFSTASPPDFGFNYSVVDLSLSNGNGAVTIKNSPLLYDTSEKQISVIKDCATKSLWVVTFAPESGAKATSGQTYFDTFYAFEVNATGINTTAVKSTFRSPRIWDERGFMKISHDGTKLAIANSLKGLFLFDFDASTGIVSNQQAITTRDSYGIEFSPNNQFLYVNAVNPTINPSGHGSSLLQYDLLAADIPGSAVSLDERGIYRGGLQLGVDGKIYRNLTINFLLGTPFLGVINNPNVKGVAANYQHDAVSLNGINGGQALPHLIHSFLEEDEVIQSFPSDTNGRLTLCENQPFTLQAQYIPGAQYSWDKDGSPLANTDDNRYQVVTAELVDAGLYSVEIIRPNGSNCTVVGVIDVVVEPLPEAATLSILQCDTDLDLPSDGFATIDLRQAHDNASNIYEYYETSEDRDLGIPISEPSLFRNSIALNQTVFYKVTNRSGCENFGEIQLHIFPAPDFKIEESYLLCTNNPQLIITAPDGFDFYTWIKVESISDQIISTDQIVKLSVIGNYILEVGLAYSDNGETTICYSSHGFQVLPSNRAFITDIIIQDNSVNNSVEVLVSGEGDYEYSIDGLIFQDSNFFRAVPSGQLTVYVRDKNGCGVVEQVVEIDPNLTMEGFPPFFTPNNDGFNDYWQFIPGDTSGDINVEVIRIYSRYGNLLAQIDPKSLGWDGTLNGRPLPSTDYWFIAISFNKEEIQGHFSLKR